MKIDKGKFLLGVFLGIVLLAIIINSKHTTSAKHPISTNKITLEAVHLPTVAVTAYISQTPSQQPSPTPVKFSGYCLNVPALLYHHVQPESEAIKLRQTALTVDNNIFDQQMAYLVSHGYTTITAKQLVDSIHLHTMLPQKSIILTFDDGYKDQYDNVYPILKKYHLIANFMIATGLIGNQNYLSWDKVEEMSHSGLIYFVDHTWSHYAVDHGGRDKIKFEIEMAKQQLEQHTGQTVNIFAYPYGSFNDETIKILQQDGFLGAFSTIPGFWQCDSFILSLHRNHIGNAPLSAYGL